MTAGLAGALTLACSRGEEGVQFIRGSARLPDCTEAPAFNLDGSVWFDNGTITLRTEGCGYDPGQVVEVCALQWQFSQDGNEVGIVVDHEYRIQGRMCGDQLHLEGGWWLPVVDDEGACTYSESNAAEVGIEEEGSVLTVAEDEMTGQLQMTGVLVVREACVGEYHVTLYPL